MVRPELEVIETGYFDLSEFGVALEASLPNIEFCAKSLVNPPFSDELLYALMWLTEAPGSSPTTWMVMAFQMYTEAFRAAGPDFGPRIIELQVKIATDQASVQRCIELRKVAKYDERDELGKIFLKTQTSLRGVARDPWREVGQKT